MNRAEIRAKFRAENPEITDRVISDSTLNAWMETADLEVCVMSRCIMSVDSEIITSVASQKSYDLEVNIQNFYDIDDMPGGGVYFDDVPLEKTSPGELNFLKRSWKTTDAGTPKKYWRRGKSLILYPTPDTAALDIAVDCVYIPYAFDNDAKEPFNGLDHLQPYCDAINKYLQWRAKAKVGKPGEGATAQSDFVSYVKWMKKTVSGYKYVAVRLTPADR